jgi:hypothetical protein
MVSINLTTRGSVDITTVWVLAPPRKYLTPLKGLARGYPGGGEDHVVGPDQVVERQLLLRVVEPVLFELLDLRALGRPHPGLHLAAEALDDGRGQDSLRRPADADDRVQLGPRIPTAMAGVRSPSGRIWILAPVSRISSIRLSCAPGRARRR